MIHYHNWAPQEIARSYQLVAWVCAAWILGHCLWYLLRRTQPGLERPYRTWGYPGVPLIFLVAALFLLGNYLVRETVSFAIDIGIILTGVPVYLWLARRERHAQPPAISVR